MAAAACEASTEGEEEGGVLYAWGRFEHGELGLGLGGPPEERGAPPEKSSDAAAAASESRAAPGPAVEADASSHWGGALAGASDEDDDGDDGGGGGARGKEAVPAGAFEQSAAGRFVSRPARVVAVPGAGAALEAACGFFHTAFVTSLGRLVTFGGGGGGQCGHGATEDLWEPREVAALVGRRVLGAACGRSHTVAVLEGGEVQCWGRAQYGQLGFETGANHDQMNPRRVAALDGLGVEAVAAGECHSLALTARGRLYAWGRGKAGRLGTGSQKARVEPRPVARLAGVVVRRVACGHYHSLAVAADGRLFAWGANNFGQLGTGATPAPALAPEQVALPGHARAAHVAAGGFHSLALGAGGRVFAWGLNHEGQLGTGGAGVEDEPAPVETFDMLAAPQTRVAWLAAGAYHSAAVTADGKLYTWGDGRYGQLGHGGVEGARYPARVAPGRRRRRWRDVSCGSWHTVAVTGSPPAGGRALRLPDPERTELLPGERAPARAAGGREITPEAEPRRHKPTPSVASLFAMLRQCAGAGRVPASAEAAAGGSDSGGGGGGGGGGGDDDSDDGCDNDVDYDGGAVDPDDRLDEKE